MEWHVLCRELWCRQLSLFRHSGTAEDTKALKLCWERGCQCWGRQRVTLVHFQGLLGTSQHESRSSDMFLFRFVTVHSVAGVGGGQVGGYLWAQCSIHEWLPLFCCWPHVGFHSAKHCQATPKLNSVSKVLSGNVQHTPLTTDNWQLTSSMLIYCRQYSAFLFISLMCNLVQDISLISIQSY
jgi:hypothetical protein